MSHGAVDPGGIDGLLPYSVVTDWTSVMLYRFAEASKPTAVK